MLLFVVVAVAVEEVVEDVVRETGVVLVVVGVVKINQTVAVKATPEQCGRREAVFCTTATD